MIAFTCGVIASNAWAHRPNKHSQANWITKTEGQKKRHISKVKRYKERKAFQRRLDIATHDFHKALVLGSEIWGVSYGWLHGCAHNEGGHGPRMIWNLGGSSAYGPMQFMPGTYLGMAGNAFRSARASGYKISWSRFYNSSFPQGRPDTLLGQALAASWAFRFGLNGHWTAYGC